jgi:hypothetical protein
MFSLLLLLFRLLFPLLGVVDIELLYVRLPKWGAREPHTGLSRSALDLLTRPQELNNFQPPVKSKILKMEGNKQGIKLVDFGSLRAYLASLPDGATSPNVRRTERSAE